VPDPEPEHDPPGGAGPAGPTPADDAGERVRQIASALPRRPRVQRRIVPPPVEPPFGPFEPPDDAA
jgi:hypothetical protein